MRSGSTKCVRARHRVQGLAMMGQGSTLCATHRQGAQGFQLLHSGSIWCARVRHGVQGFHLVRMGSHPVRTIANPPPKEREHLEPGCIQIEPSRRSTGHGVESSPPFEPCSIKLNPSYFQHFVEKCGTLSHFGHPKHYKTSVFCYVRVCRVRFHVAGFANYTAAGYDYLQQGSQL